jgi:hypothetical protein
VTKDLNEVRDKLYKAFDRALTQCDEVSSYSSGSTCEKVSARSLAMSAAAQTAQALTAVEHEIVVQKAYEEWQKSGGRIDDEIAGGIIRDVKTMATLKIKRPESP